MKNHYFQQSYLFSPFSDQNLSQRVPLKPFLEKTEQSFDTHLKIRKGSNMETKKEMHHVPVTSAFDQVASGFQ